MNYAAYQRLVIAYHGCDASVAHDVLEKEGSLKPSQNDYDWLGHGIYFWEHGPSRALDWARQQQVRGKIRKPAVIGAILHLGNCFDLLDTYFTNVLADVFPSFREATTALDGSFSNSPAHAQDSDTLLRRLDCAVINWAIGKFQQTNPDQPRFQSVRGVFQEGEPAFPESTIRRKSHIQIAVRDPACIVGYFRPS